MLPDLRRSQHYFSKSVAFVAVEIALGLQLLVMPAHVPVLRLQSLQRLPHILVPLFLASPKPGGSPSIPVALLVCLTRALVHVQRHRDMFSCIGLERKMRL